MTEEFDQTPKVYNVKRNPPVGSVYIGRSTKWGNPFPINAKMDRDEVCNRFDEYLKGRPDLIEAAKSELKGKNLVCHCKPARCHGDTLLRVANESD